MIPKFEKKKTFISLQSILHFDQYPRLSIRSNIFKFSANNSKTNSKFQEYFPLVCRACWDESIDIQHIALWLICMNCYSFKYFSGFWQIIWKTNLKLRFPFICRTRRDESIDVQHQRFRIKKKYSFSFEHRGTDGQIDGIDFGMYLPYMTRLRKLKISGRRGKQYTSPVTLGGRHNSNYHV